MTQIAETPPPPQAIALIANITQMMDQVEQMLRDSPDVCDESRNESLRIQHDPRGPDLFSSAGKMIATSVSQAGQAISAHPYQSLAIGVGAGALLGVVLARRSA